MCIVHKKLASVVTAAVLMVTISTTSVLASPLSDKLRNQQNQLSEHNSDYKDARREVENIEQKIEHLDDQIETAMSEISDTKIKIKEITNSVEQAEKDIEKAEKDIEDEQELYNQRMRAMYKKGSSGYLDVILGSKDMSDLLSKTEAVKKLTELDKKIVKELKEKQDEIKRKKEELAQEQQQLVSLKVKQEEKMSKLKNDKQEQDKLVKDAKNKKTLYANKIRSDKRQITETKKLIDKMSASVPKYDPSRGSAPISQNAVVAYSRNYLGRPYVWGATGPNSFDCSGLMKYVYAHFGVRLPRVSRDQARAGKYVPKSQLQPGDLVFFAYSGGRGTIHHVGMYVGNGCYIHAPRTGDVVKISTLSGRSDYATARRVM
ncbi:NlpC/P60 family protein [Clostridium aestuarii]|uniref:NlpC/P60 family protein n=1 Tax=Clostridium aestuarii TaxID=338193 RepID=A0ABT4D3M2_9CLOT|nr:C40 family peptidase [Clostridium aestuarii]MCY6484795.1 NlpC/P60 family protein [Clostridium aestuarii]